MTRDEYNAAPGLRWSTLALMRHSPLAYLRTERREVSSQRLGTLAHAIVLEGLTEADVRVWETRRAGKAYDAAVAEAAADGVELVSRADWDAATAIALGFERHTLAREILARGAHEQALSWRERGREMKALLDHVDAERGEVWDLKTMRGPLSARAVGAAVLRYGYHGQLAHYCAGARAVYGLDHVRECGLIIVDSASPHDVMVAPMLAPERSVGDELRESLLARLEECEASGAWPGAWPERVPIDLPGWAYETGEGDDE